MKGLDTPVLLELLRGSTSARALVRTLGGEELATTEINLFELETIARLDPRPGRDRRLAALEKLRRRLTVVPIDSRSTAATRTQDPRPRGQPSVSRLVLGALEAAGCSEVYTIDGPRAGRSSGVRVRRYSLSSTNKRQ